MRTNTNTIDHPARCRRLATTLAEHRALWAPRPFTNLDLPWTQDHPELAAALLRLRPQDIDALEADPRATTLPEPWPTLLEHLEALTDLPRAATTAVTAISARSALRYRVKARKWSQIQWFLAAGIESIQGATRIVDWCAGKGHLGRTASAITEIPVLHLERQEQLCDDGARHASRLRVDATFRTCDVMNLDPGDIDDIFSPGSVGLGLHACGGLGAELLRAADAAGAQALLHAPCCYHTLIPETGYQPLSEAARHSELHLTSHQLRLAIYDEVVAPTRERDARRLGQAYRLAVDLLLREASGHDAYTSLGVLHAGWRNQDFETFAHATADRLHLELPRRWSPTDALQRGQRRANHARALALLRTLFRRPLELYVASDRAAFLSERGWDVQLQTFCPHTLTPRNILIQARRRRRPLSGERSPVAT